MLRQKDPCCHGPDARRHRPGFFTRVDDVEPVQRQVAQGSPPYGLGCLTKKATTISPQVNAFGGWQPNAMSCPGLPPLRSALPG